MRVAVLYRESFFISASLMLYKVCPEKVMKGTSLVVQWLGIHASNAGGIDWIPGQGTKIPHATWHGQKITADDDCTHETKRCLLLGRKAMKNLDSVLKSRDIILPTKVHLVKAMVLLVVMYGCEG